MDQLSSNSALSSYAADYQYHSSSVEKSSIEKPAGKKKVSGRTVGEPELSEKALKYYEKLKKKYSNMEFILVSPDKKEEAERNKGMYKSSSELLVLIDSDKIEQMAEDEEYRRKYENILSGATAKMAQMKTSLSGNGNADKVSSVGVTFDDHGNASFFAVIDKSLAAQRERISEKAAEAAQDKKEAAKKAAEKKAKEAKAARSDDAQRDTIERSDIVTVTAPTWDELWKKIDDVMLAQRADDVRTDAEKKVGQAFDYTI